MLRESTQRVAAQFRQEFTNALRGSTLDLRSDLGETHLRWRRYYATSPWVQGLVNGLCWACAVALVDSFTGYLMAGKALYAFPVWIAARRGSTLAGLIMTIVCMGLFARSLQLDGLDTGRYLEENIALCLALVGTMLYADRSGKKFETIQKQVIQDPLTGALNRNGLNICFQNLLRETQADPRTLVAAVVDLDKFKQLNDTYGHALGDTALVSLVKTIKGVLDEESLVCRTGGDEFVVIFAHSHAGMAKRTLEEARVKFQRLTRQMGCPASFSFGLASMESDDEKSLSELIEEADAAMYRAKAARSGQAVIAG